MRRKKKEKEGKERKGRKDNLDIHKNRYYHPPNAPVERIQSTFSNTITRKRKKLVLLFFKKALYEVKASDLQVRLNVFR